MTMDEATTRFLTFLQQHGGDWKVWAGLVLCLLAWGVRKAKRFRFLIEYTSKE